MRRILFRADANPAIGTGDLVSLVYLADVFGKNGWEPGFMVRGYGDSLAICEKYGLEDVSTIPPGASLAEEEAAIRELVLGRGVDALFLEVTERPLSDYRGLPREVFKGCVCFDGRIPEGMDLVVDWDVAANEFFSPGEHPETIFLLGPEFVFLPPEFDMERVAARTYRPEPERILVSMGGADELDFTRVCAEALAALGVEAEVRFVLGPSYAGRRDLEAFLDSSGMRHSLAVDVRDMFGEYLACDFAVGAGGLTSSELVASGTPCALVALYDHQVARCEYFGRQGLAAYLGYRRCDALELGMALSARTCNQQRLSFHGKEEVFRIVDHHRQ